MQPKTIKNNKLKEEFCIKELNNGLKIFYIPKKDYVKQYAIFATKYGSNDNRFVPINESDFIEVPQGIAHFLEHKLFEEPNGNIFDEFSKLGSYVNAYTTFNQTAYLFSCTDKFYENLELLVKFVQNPYFTDENVEKEKGIIEQEIRMYQDTPGWRLYSNCLSGMYVKHPVKIDIAGTVESIRQINKELLYKCYNTFYHPSNMVLVIVGDIDINKALDIIEKNQNIKENTSKEIKRVYEEEPKEINEEIIEESSSISTPIFNIGFKDFDVGYDGKKLVHKEICINMILEMLFGYSSEFFQQLYEEGLINNSFGSQYVAYKDYGHSIIGGESENPKLVLDKIIKYIEEVKSKGLDKDSFNRIKKKFIGYNFEEFNSIESIGNNFASYYFKNFNFLEYANLTENITFPDIEERFVKHFNNNYTLSIVSPKK
ncbi:M16 family peptidase [Gottschalkia purinilytica]|uniref:M16 family peptidase n=1 Tax=Gottschalkia purinilytica TaxID=1503 RepID=A0A0L0WEM5_GOTPU|nr:pitrilysin family protein [Gottschalkia purinilytica]KNF09932.1 M16 family peptidase [Gottschalkia purinilytica]